MIFFKLMDIQKYFEKLNIESQGVFLRSTSEKEKLGTLHHLSSCVYEFSKCVIDPQEQKILETVCVQSCTTGKAGGLKEPEPLKAVENQEPPEGDC